MNKLFVPLTLLPTMIAAAPFAHAAPVVYKLVHKFPLASAGGWDYLTADSHGRRIYIANTDQVLVVNIDTGKLIGKISGTSGVHGIALDSKLNRGFTSNGRANSVTVFNMETLKTITDIPVGAMPDAIVFDPATDRVFTFNGRDQSATAIDAKTDTVIGTIPLPGRPEFPVVDGQGHIYDNIEDENEIVAINSKTLRMENTWPTAPGTEPSGISMDVKHHRLFSLCHNQTMIVMDSITGKVVATPAIGNGPDAAAFDPKFHYAFSPNGSDGTLTVIEEQTPDTYTIVGTFPTQVGARTIAWDEKTHRILSVTANVQAPAPNAPTQPRWRRSYVPGTFVLLEYGR